MAPGQASQEGRLQNPFQGPERADQPRSRRTVQENDSPAATAGAGPYCNQWVSHEGFGAEKTDIGIDLLIALSILQHFLNEETGSRVKTRGVGGEILLRFPHKI